MVSQGAAAVYRRSAETISRPSVSRGLNGMPVHRQNPIMTGRAVAYGARDLTTAAVRDISGRPVKDSLKVFTMKIFGKQKKKQGQIPERTAKSKKHSSEEQKRLIKEGREKEAAALKKAKYILSSSRETLERKDAEAAAGKLVSKGSDLFNKPEKKQKGGLKERYDALIKDNELFLAIDIVKEKLDIAYSAASVDEMRAQIKEITDICRGTENKHFIWFARLLEDHEEGIVYCAKYKIGTSKLEGFNNAIKTERRQGNPNIGISLTTNTSSYD